MSRVRVVEPMTQVVVEVDAKSPLATTWAKADEKQKAASPRRRQAAPVKE